MIGAPAVPSRRALLNSLLRKPRRKPQDEGSGPPCIYIPKGTSTRSRGLLGPLRAFWCFQKRPESVNFTLCWRGTSTTHFLSARAPAVRPSTIHGFRKRLFRWRGWHFARGFRSPARLFSRRPAEAEPCRKRPMACFLDFLLAGFDFNPLAVLSKRAPS